MQGHYNGTFPLIYPQFWHQKQNKMRATILISFIFITLAIQNLFAQDGQVWATIKDNAIIPIIKGETLNSTDLNFNKVIQSMNIVAVKKAFPASKSELLQNVYEITCKCDQTDLYAELVNNVKSLSSIEFAPKYESLSVPNDYSLNFSSDYALDLIGAEKAWETTQGNEAIRIAISDLNFESNHEELVGKITYYDSTNKTSTAHGTAVAILAAGNTNNGIGKSAIGYNSSLALYKLGYNELLAASYSGIKVINVSWTSGCSFSNYTQTVINEIYNNGTFIIAAAGNGVTCGGPDSLVYPAAYDHVFSVTSIGPKDNHEQVIGWPSTTHQHNATVDLSAPGYLVAISSKNGVYTLGTGTSYAAPMVAGTVALLYAVNPCLTPNEIETILKKSSDNIDAVNPNYNGLIGVGRLNAARAVSMAKNYNIVVTEPKCYGENSGEIALTFNSTTISHCHWGNGDTNSVRTNLEAGIYKVRIDYLNGCSVVERISVRQPEAIAVDANLVQPTTGTNGMIELAINGGLPEYTILWSNGETTTSIENLLPGDYQVSVTDKQGCKKEASFGLISTQQINLNLASLDEVNDLNAQVFPNPSEGNAKVTWSNNEVELIQVINENGQIVLNETVKFANELNLENLNSGVYFIQLSSLKQKNNLKLVVL